MSAHHHLTITEPACFLPVDTIFTGFVPKRDADSADGAGANHPALSGRAALNFRAGPFDLTLRPTSADLRRLASVCTLLADELEAERTATVHHNNSSPGAAGGDASAPEHATCSGPDPRPRDGAAFSFSEMVKSMDFA